MTIKAFDERRDIMIPGGKEATIEFAVNHFIQIANEAIDKRDGFYVALSGGSTPKAIFERLASSRYNEKIDWTKVFLFWSDERCVGPNNPDSNFRMAMEAGFKKLPIPEAHIYRMKGEEHPEESALDYEGIINSFLPNETFDLVMLGMGEDCHTASLFPNTHGLHTEHHRMVIANFLPEKDTWRLTLTFSCINKARHIAIYVLGENKAASVKKVFFENYDPNNFPIQKIGEPHHKALWVMDRLAAKEFNTALT